MKQLVILMLLFTTLKAQDRFFANIYSSNNLTAGQRDLEVWNNFEIGRQDYYHKSIHKLELEIGLNKKWQTSFYLNLEETKAYNKTSQEIESEATSFSFSNEWKYNYRKSAEHKWGQAIYAEYYIKPGEFELEGKWILDRFFGKNYFGFNVVAEHEWELEKSENGKLEYETELNNEFAFGYMHFIHKWGYGIESKVQSTWEENELQHSSLFAGPTLSYGGNKWWIIANITPQISKLKSTYSGDKHLNLTDQEKVHASIIFAVNL